MLKNGGEEIWPAEMDRPAEKVKVHCPAPRSTVGLHVISGSQSTLPPNGVPRYPRLCSAPEQGLLSYLCSHHTSTCIWGLQLLSLHSLEDFSTDLECDFLRSATKDHSDVHEGCDRETTQVGSPQGLPVSNGRDLALPSAHLTAKLACGA